MKSIQISLSAQNYADALVKLGADDILSYDNILKNLEIIEEICKNSADLVAVLENPTISADKKYSIIDEVFTNHIDKKIKDFIKILIEKKRFNDFKGIAEAYRKEIDKINNIKRISVFSAVELKEQAKQKIVEKMQTKLKKNIVTEWLVNEEIIGGLVIKIGDDVIDTSLKNKLENLSKNITK